MLTWLSPVSRFKMGPGVSAGSVTKREMHRVGAVCLFALHFANVEHGILLGLWVPAGQTLLQ